MKRGTGSVEKRKEKGIRDRGGWIVGGTTLLGLGVGFLLLTVSPLYFVASLLMGIGMGLVIAALFSGNRK